MVKKLKALAKGKSDGDLVVRIRSSANQIWLAGLGAFAKAQGEGTKFFDGLVKEGEAVQAKAKKAAGSRISEVTARATGSWDKLEQVFEDRVAQVLSTLSVPTKKDIDALSHRVSTLTHEVKKIAGEKPHRRAAAE